LKAWTQPLNSASLCARAVAPAAPAAGLGDAVEHGLNRGVLVMPGMFSTTTRCRSLSSTRVLIMV